MAKKAKPAAKTVKAERTPNPTSAPGPFAGKGPRLYTLDVFLIDGWATKAFAKNKKKRTTVSRTIQIRGDQTLEDLHDAIFGAFDRFDEHLYEFQFGERPQDPEGRRYGLSWPSGGENYTGFVERTSMDSMRLTVGRGFGYWFDFGDDWWHQINVEAIEDEAPEGKYPKVIERVGDSPPQYPDMDEMEEEDQEDEDEDEGE